MIKNIGIIGGTGNMGSCFKNAFESIGLNVQVSDINSKDKEDHIIENSDWIILTVPISETLKVFKNIKNKIKEDQIFSDFTSVKSILANDIGNSNFEFISCHPLFGPLNNLKGQNIVTIPIVSKEKYPMVVKVFEKIGLKITELKSLNEHDKYMSLIQGMTHFSHVCFTTAMKKLNPDLDKIMEICSPIYQSNISFSSRITGGDENLYTNIIMDNPLNKKVIQLYLETAKELFEKIEKDDHKSFKENFIENRKYLKNHLDKMISQSDFLVNKMAEFKNKPKD
tara:strand:- start:113 stop:958 length:846 start_codon:yes stop_codon:yes gene_type:complete